MSNSKPESPSQSPSPSSIVNHRNHSGNTPLHWAALNTHLECVKALVSAGADISAKNNAGLDAVFLAERTALSSAVVEDRPQQQQQQRKEEEEEQHDHDGKEDDLGEMSPGRAVVEWLLDCDKGGSLECPAGEDQGSTASGNGTGSTAAAADAMETG